MMAEEKAKVDFNTVLLFLKRKFSITDVKWSENKYLEVKYRTQIFIKDENYNKYCDEYVEQFSNVTNTIWVHKSSNTGRHVKFRKQYQCWPYQTKEVDKKLLFDPRRCRATLDVKVLGNVTAEKNNSNRYLRLGLNVLVKLNFQHLHEVDTSKNFTFYTHSCNPLDEVPKPPAISPEKMLRLVSKVVEKASLKAEYIDKDEKQSSAMQRVADENQKTQDYINSCQYSRQKIEVNYGFPVTQGNHITKANDNLMYIHQMVFDSTTQTLTELTPVMSSEVDQSLSQSQL
ncbi:hypothetical protein ABEB36_007474 [Hypothenemus hampei]